MIGFHYFIKPTSYQGDFSKISRINPYVEKAQKCVKRGKNPLSVLVDNKPKTTMTFYQILAEEYKCQISKS